MRKRTSIIWKIPLEEFKKIVKSSNSLADILKHFGFVLASGNYKTLKKRLNEDNINYSHIPLGLNSNRNRKFPSRAIPLKEVMIKNSTYDRGHLKKRLLKNGMLKNECVICGQPPTHNGQELVMVLDHKNGINNDHREENLRLLCPNCNSQQKTFAGRKLRKKYNCKKCGKEINKRSKSLLCIKCVIRNQNKNNYKQRKIIDRPSKELLLQEIEETNYCAVGRKYGVSDNAIRKWIK